VEAGADKKSVLVAAAVGSGLAEDLVAAILISNAIGELKGLFNEVLALLAIIKALERVLALIVERFGFLIKVNIWVKAITLVATLLSVAKAIDSAQSLIQDILDNAEKINGGDGIGGITAVAVENFDCKSR
jgi:hypothetical protein